MPRVQEELKPSLGLHAGRMPCHSSHILHRDPEPFALARGVIFSGTLEHGMNVTPSRICTGPADIFGPWDQRYLSVRRKRSIDDVMRRIRAVRWAGVRTVVRIGFGRSRVGMWDQVAAIQCIQLSDIGVEGGYA